jgi:hypothetical protein
MDLQTFYQDTLHELGRATKDRRHPFRQLHLATNGQTHPDLRIVILRAFDRTAHQLIFYTDYRSHKVQQLKIQEEATALFWHPSKKLQVKAKCLAEFADDEERENRWQQLSGGKESYNTEQAPGTLVDDLPQAHQWKEEMDAEYFSVVKLNIQQIEVLQLSGKEHLRAFYDFTAARKADQSWMVP